MSKRSSKRKRPRDANALAKSIVDEATGQAEPEPKSDMAEPLGMFEDEFQEMYGHGFRGLRLVV